MGSTSGLPRKCLHLRLHTRPEYISQEGSGNENRWENPEISPQNKTPSSPALMIICPLVNKFAGLRSHYSLQLLLDWPRREKIIPDFPPLLLLHPTFFELWRARLMPPPVPCPSRTSLPHLSLSYLSICLGHVDDPISGSWSEKAANLIPLSSLVDRVCARDPPTTIILSVWGSVHYPLLPSYYRYLVKK